LRSLAHGPRLEQHGSWSKTQGSKQVGVSPPPPTFSDIRKNPKIPEARIPSRKQPRYSSLEWAVAGEGYWDLGQLPSTVSCWFSYSTWKGWIMATTSDSSLSAYRHHSRASTLVQPDALQLDPPQVHHHHSQAQTNSWSPRAGLASLCSVRYRAHLNSSLDSRVPSHGTVPHETCLGGLSTVDREPTYHRRRSGPQSGLATLNLVRAPPSLRAPSANRLSPSVSTLNFLLIAAGLLRHDVFTLFTPTDSVIVSDRFNGGLNPTARSRRTECCAGQKFGLKYLFFLSVCGQVQPAFYAARRSIVDLGRLVATVLGAYQTLARTDSMGSFTME
ncbi:hypothetical protein CCUS01_10620, partial [Colletotrichum cuscutae]